MRGRGPTLGLSLLIAAASACGSHGAMSSAADASTTLDGSADGGADGQASLCVDGQSVDGAYPKRPGTFTLLGTLPDLSFDGLDDGGNPTTAALHDYFEPCAAQSRLLVIRVGAAWCGTCKWHAAHTGELTSKDFGPRLELLDLLVANEDNAPAKVGDLTAWRGKIDAPGKLAIDPTYRLNALNASRLPIPLVVLVDTRTMTVQNTLNDPDPQLLEIRIRQVLADLDGVPEPAYPDLERFDKIFTRNQWDLLHEMTLPGAPPPDPTNAKADDPAAAALGKQLFSDTALSPSGSVSCASCHRPDQQFQDGAPQSHDGVAIVDRNSPYIALSSHARWQFWDGRADTLWMQALGPPESAKEFGSSRLFIDHVVDAKYKTTYEAIFGALPPLSDTARFPATGKPGDASWTAMAVADQDAATRVFVNVGKSIAAYERTMRVQPNALDKYVGGDAAALTQPQKVGLLNFFQTGCAQCHYGPRLTDDAFHDVRFPTGRQDGQADRGRIDAIAGLLANDFNAGGKYSDAPSAGHLAGLAADPTMLGAFKTPTLRGVASSSPFGHGGTLATLADVAKNYSEAGLADDSPLTVGPSDPWLPKFTKEHADALVPFLQVLRGDPVP